MKSTYYPFRIRERTWMILTMALTLALLSGCGDGSISRKQVINKIEGKINADRHLVVHFHPIVGRYEWGDCKYPTGVTHKDGIHTKHLGDKLSRLGLFDVTRSHLKTFGAIVADKHKYQYQFSLRKDTADEVVGHQSRIGASSCSKTVNDRISIYLGKLGDIEIKGIEKTSSMLNTARFQIEVENNEASRELFPNFAYFEGSFEFQLWDDGWREKNFRVNNPFGGSYGNMKVSYNTISAVTLANSKLTLMQNIGRYSDDYKNLVNEILDSDEVEPKDIQTVAQSYCDNGDIDKAYEIFEKRILKKLDGEQLETWMKNFDNFKSQCKPTSATKNHRQGSKPVFIETNSSGEEIEPQNEKTYFARTSKWISSLFGIKESTQPRTIEDKVSDISNNPERQTPSLNKEEHKPQNQLLEMQPITSQNAASTPPANSKESLSGAKTITSNVESINEQTELKQKNLVLSIQRELTRLNLYHSRIDGIAGKGTIRGIKEFERQMGLPISGAATPELFERIRAVPKNSIIPIDAIAKQTDHQEEKPEGTIIGNAAKKSFRWLGDKLKGKN